MKKLLIFVLSVLLLLSGCTYINENVEDLEIHIIDIGQGDAILLRHKDKTTLIDSGQYKEYDKLKAYLQGEGVSYINYVIATHPDSDHIGSMSEVLEDFEIGSVYMPDKGHTTTSYKEFIKAIDKNNIPVVYGEANMNFELSSEVTGKFLSPQNTYYSENNHYSLVLYLEYKEYSFIFMGDAEKENEEEILRNYPELKVNFLKLGHHGSSSSSTEKFIKALNPSVGAISVGKDNSYGHPHREVVELMENQQIPIYRTDEQGSLVFYCNGESLQTNQKQPASYNKGN